MTNRIHVTASETGESPFAVRIKVGSYVLTGDESFEAGGGGLGPAPYELLAAALAECTVMTVRWYARRQGWSVERVEAEVVYSKKLLAGASVPGDVFQKTLFIFGADIADEQRTKLFDVAAKCPVHRTLESGSSIETIWGEIDG